MEIIHGINENNKNEADAVKKCDRYASIVILTDTL